MPALPFNPDNANRRLEDVQARIDGAENSAVHIITKVADNIENTIVPMERFTEDTVKKLIKPITKTLDNHTVTRNDMAARLYNDMDQHLSNAYVDAYGLGATYPNMDRVRQANESGDHFRALEFTPPDVANTTMDVPQLPPMERVLDTPLPTREPIAVPGQQPKDDIPPKGDDTIALPIKEPMPPNQTVPPPPITVINTPTPQLPTEPPGFLPPPFTPPPTTPPGIGPAGNKSIPLVLWWGNCQSASEPFYDPRLTNGTNFDPFVPQAPAGCDNTWNKIDGTTYVGGPVQPNQYVFQTYDDSGRTQVRLFSPFVGYKPYAVYLKNSGKYTVMFSAAEVCNPNAVCATTPPPDTPPPLPPTTPPPDTPPTTPPTTPPNTNSCGTVGPSPNVKYPGGECMNFAKMVEELAKVVWSPANFLAFTGLPQQGGISIISSIANMLMSGPNGILTATVQRFTCWLEGVIKNVTKDVDCDVAKLLPVAVFNGVVQFIQKWTGALPEPVMANLQQAINFTCQSFFPAQGAANALFNAGKITEEVWQCYTKVAGNHVGPQKDVRELTRTRLDPAQWTALYMREIIGKDTWLEKLGELGVVYDNEKQAYRDLQIAQPQLDDVIRMMVRDVADKDLVERFGMDEDFDKKWAPPLNKLGEHLGLQPETAKLYWRAHWRLPSPTQLYEMLHRLRPGRVPEEVQVTEQDVEDALKQDDLLPYWVKREMAVSYGQLRLVDIRRAYLMEAFDDEELYELLLDRGYDVKNATIMKAYWIKIKEEADLKKMGAPNPKVYAKLYVQRVIDEGEFHERMGELGMSEGAVNTMQKFAELDQTYNDRKELIASTKKLFMNGLIGADQVTSRFAEGDVPVEVANQLIQNWQHNITKKPKEVSAAMLCKWRGQQVITPSQQKAALIRIGYTQDMATLISRSCEFEIQEKQAKAEQRAIDKALKDAEKARKETQKAQKDAQKEAEKNAK